MIRSIRLARRAMWIAAALVAASGAVASEAEPEMTVEEILDDAPATAAERVCINVRLIRGFDALSDEHLVVTTSGRDTYLLTMRRGCIGLGRAMGIAVSNNMSRLCSNSRGKVTYRDLSRRPLQCQIENITAVESKEHARALVSSD